MTAQPSAIQSVRKEIRIPRCQPVTVWSEDNSGKYESRVFWTVEISSSGARLRDMESATPGASLLLEHQGKLARYRVVWVGSKGSVYQGQVGLRCLEPEKSIFGIEPLLDLYYEDYRRMESALQRSEGRYRDLVEGSLGLIYTHDMQGKLLSVNPAAARALGCEPAEGVGKNLSDFLIASARPMLPEYLCRFRSQGQDSGYVRLLAKDQSERVWFYKNLVMHEAGEPDYVLGHAQDVTEQTRIKRQLQITVDKLQKALAQVRILSRLLPICAWCKKIRTDAGYWTKLESYLGEHLDITFSHGICADCGPKLKKGEL